MSSNGIYYIVKNQEEYDWLMKYLENEGCCWRYHYNDRALPTALNFFPSKDEWEDINYVDLHLFEIFRLGKNIEYGLNMVHSLDERRDNDIDVTDLME